MADKVGYPFNQIPPNAFVVGAAGYAGLHTFCGVLPSCAAFIGLVCDAAKQREVVKTLWEWYMQEPFPTYEPAGSNMKLTASVAESVNCMDSVGKFMAAQQVSFASDERRERCARVTAECVKKTVQLLNAAL